MANLKEIFDAIDTDGSGFVDKKELKAMVKTCSDAGLLGEKLTDAQIDETVASIMELCEDDKPDGKLSFKEFETGMSKLMK